MIIADYVALGLTALFCLIGIIVGFGKGLKFFTSGFFGFLISVLVCYCIGGFIFKLSFIQTLLDKLIAAMAGKNGFCDFLVKIHIEVIIFYVALFIIVTILRVIIVSIIKSVVEIGNPVLKLINRLLGLVLFAAVLVLITLFVFHIISLIGGSTAEGFVSKLAGSKLRLDLVYAKNPIVNIIKAIKKVG